MAAVLIDGKAVAARIREGLKGRIAILTAQHKQPGLAVVIVGDNPASRQYVNMKKKACAELGIYSEEHSLSAQTSNEQLLDLIDQLNHES